MRQTSAPTRGRVAAAAIAFVFVEALFQGFWPAPGAPAWAPAEGVVCAAAVALVAALVRRPAWVAGGLVALAAAHTGVPWWPVPALVVGLITTRLPRAGLVIAVGTAVWPAALRVRPALLAEGPRDRSSDVLLITVDTLRDDAPFDLGPGWWRATSVSAAPWTLPSMDSLMRGAPVRAHGGGLFVDGAYTRPDLGTNVLAEDMAAAGYQTVALVSNPHLRASMGFDEGFMVFEHADDWREVHALVGLVDGLLARSGRPRRIVHERDERLIDRATDVLATAGPRPLFLWVHLMLPHEYTRDAVDPPAGWVAGTEDPGAKRAAYIGNVRASAALVRTLVADAEGRVIVTSDHGESLGEAGIWGHGRTLCDEQLLVPLWVRGALGPRPPAPGAAIDVAALARDGQLPVPREAVEVGGVRRDAAAFAIRRSDGDYVPQSPPERFGRPREPEAELREALEAIGYLGPG